MQRLFSDFNNNIKAELEQTETVNPKRVSSAAKRVEETKANYLNFARIQGVLTRRANKYKDTDPALAQTALDNREYYFKLREAAETRYRNAKNDYNRETGIDYNVIINVHVFRNSANPENRKPLIVAKSRLLRMKNPAAFILKEQKKRLKFELGETNAAIDNLSAKLFNGITDNELTFLNRLEAARKGLKTLISKTAGSINSLLGNAAGEDEESGEYEPDVNDTYDENDDESGGGGKETGSDKVPFFYTPASGFIDLY